MGQAAASKKILQQDFERVLGVGGASYNSQFASYEGCAALPFLDQAHQVMESLREIDANAKLVGKSLVTQLLPLVSHLRARLQAVQEGNEKLTMQDRELLLVGLSMPISCVRVSCIRLVEFFFV
ncbi:hypothetical protein EON63_19705 [archaeon]|nr:MAG: hypothetical protein EON63_19705 [archaeon]